MPSSNCPAKWDTEIDADSRVESSADRLAHGGQEQVVYYYSFESQRRRLPVPGLAVAVYFAELQVMLAHSLDPSLLYSGQREVEFSRAPWPLKALRVMRYCRALVRPNVPVGFAALAPGYTFVTLMGLQLLAIARGNLSMRMWLYLSKLINSVGPALGSFILNVNVLCLMYLDTKDSVSVALFCTSALALALTLISWFRTAFLCFAPRPSWGALAVSHQIFLAMFAAGRILLCVLDATVNHSSLPTSRARVILYALSVVVTMAALESAHVYHQHFFNEKFNRALACLGGACVGASAVQLVAVIVNKPQASPWFLLAAILATAPFAGLGFLLANWRLKVACKRAQRVVEGLNAGADASVYFKGVGSYEFCVASNRMLAKQDHSAAELYLRAGMKVHPKSAKLHVAYALYQAEVKGDHNLFIRELRRARNLKPPFWQAYRMYTLEMSFTGQDSKDSDMLLDLSLAKLHHSAAKKAMAEFWSKVSRMHGALDADQLLATVSTLEHHESEARKTFARLLEDNPTNIAVMRAFAHFLDDIIDDKEQASLLISNAEDLEDQQAQRKAKHARKLLDKPSKEVHMSTIVECSSPEVTPSCEPTLPNAVPVPLAPAQAQAPVPTRSPSVDATSECKSATMESLSSFTTASALGGDRVKLLQYRSRIVGDKSKAVKRLWLSIAVTVLLLLSLCVATFVIVLTSARDMRAASALSRATVEVRLRLVEAPLLIRSIQKNANGAEWHDYDALSGILNHYWDELQKDKTQWSTLGSVLPIVKYWPGLPQNETWERINATFWTACASSVGAVTKAAMEVRNQSDDVERMTDMRFVVDNVANRVVPAFSDFIKEQSDSLLRKQATTQLSLSILLPVIVAVCVGSVLGLFFPSMFKIRQERKAAVALFSEIPKSTCAKYEAALQYEKDRLQESVRSDKVAVSERKASVVRSITLLYMALLILVIACSTVSLLVLLSGTSSGPKVAKIRLAQSNRTTNLFAMALYSIEIATHRNDSVLPLTDLEAGFWAFQGWFQEQRDILRVKHVEKSQMALMRRRRAEDKQFTFGEGDTGLSIVRKDGTTTPVLVSAVKVGSDAATTFTCFLKDISGIKEHELELQHERRRADLLLKNILPDSVVEELKSDPDKTVAQSFPSVTVLFADIVDFTPKAAGMSPESLVRMLNGLFSKLDALCEDYGVEKIKTIGDAYMVACGVPVPCTDHARRVVDFAVVALRALEEYNAENVKHGLPALQIRIGVNTGPVVAGVIGKSKLQYDMWGDAVNLSARLEQSGVPNRIQVSRSTHEALKDAYEFEPRGKITLKGKGEQECYLVGPVRSTSVRVSARDTGRREGPIDLMRIIATAANKIPRTQSVASSIIAISSPH